MNLGIILRFVKTANFTELWDQLLAEGKSAFTVSQVEERTGASGNAIYGAERRTQNCSG